MTSSASRDLVKAVKFWEKEELSIGLGTAHFSDPFNAHALKKINKGGP